MIDNPTCIYKTQDADADQPTESAFMERTSDDDVLDPQGTSDEDVGDDLGNEAEEPIACLDETNNGNDNSLSFTQEAREFLSSIEKDNDVDQDDIQQYSIEGSEATEAQVRMAGNKQFNEVLEKLIEEADKLADERINEDFEGEKNLHIEEISEAAIFKSVLGDIFHFMDRAKLPMHHEYKALFFRALRAAIFIMNKEDVIKVKSVLEAQGKSWEKTLAFNFDYIAARVRRSVPPLSILYNRMLAVYNFFKDRKDTKTGHVLFHETNRNKFENMLEIVKLGYASDPPGLAMYVQKTDKQGKEMYDKDGLPLYRSICGTSNLESLHQFLTTSFGHTMSGPWYSDSLLTVVRHFYNWRMSRKNRPHFPQIGHYDGLLLDRINNLYELVYGHPKYRSWSEFNENLPIESAYGVVPINKRHVSPLSCTPSDKIELSKQKTLVYLAERQKSPIPFLPVRSEGEKKLVHRKLNELVQKDVSMGNQNVFDQLSLDWNTHHVDVKNKRYAKLPNHFSRYLKSWTKNQDTKDAEVASESNRLFDALEYVPETQDLGTFQQTELFTPPAQTNQTTENSSTTNTPTTLTDTPPTAQDSTETPSTNLETLVCVACRQNPVSTEETEDDQPKKKQRSRNCQVEGCPNPSKCPGSSDRENCLSKTNGDPLKKRKRKVTKTYERRCFHCKGVGCPGSQNRDNCMYK